MLNRIPTWSKLDTWLTLFLFLFALVFITHSLFNGAVVAILLITITCLMIGHYPKFEAWIKQNIWIFNVIEIIVSLFDMLCATALFNGEFHYNFGDIIMFLLMVIIITTIICVYLYEKYIK